VRLQKEEHCKASTLGPWIDYKSHFDACVQINEWSQKEKGLYLAVSLRGQAQGVLGNLPLELSQDYKELVKSLEERFSPSNQTELYANRRTSCPSSGNVSMAFCLRSLSCVLYNSV
jgi:hypothetical protein